MWRPIICRGYEKDRSNPTYRSLLGMIGIVAFAIGTGLPVTAQEAPTAGPDSLVDSEAAVKGQPTRISDWALAGVVWSDAHLVRKLAQKEAAITDDSQRRERMYVLIEDANQVIEILQDFGWRSLPAGQAERAANEDAPPPTRRLERVPPADRTVEEEPPASGVHFDLRRYRVIGDDIPTERRSLVDAVEAGVEEALAARVENVSPDGRAKLSQSRTTRRNVATRSDTLPYSRGSIYDPGIEDEITVSPNRPAPSERSSAVERREEYLNRPPGERPEPFPLDSSEVDDEVSDNRPSAVVADSTDLRRFTERLEPFDQDAAWVQFQFDANQRTWQLVQAQPADDSVRRYLDAAVAQLQAHAQVGERLTDDPRLAAIFQVIGGEE